jgi:hypothetical protein
MCACINVSGLAWASTAGTPRTAAKHLAWVGLVHHKVL